MILSRPVGHARPSQRPAASGLAAKAKSPDGAPTASIAAAELGNLQEFTPVIGVYFSADRGLH